MTKDKIQKPINKLFLLHFLDFTYKVEQREKHPIVLLVPVVQATASFGHGITTTPIQLAKAYAIVSNGGYEINPTLIKKDKIETKKRILEEEVSLKINNILRKIVTTKEVQLKQLLEVK